MASVWRLGVDATTLVDLPTVTQASKPLQRVGGTHTSLSGAQTIDTVAMKAQITLTFDYLTDAEYETILQFWDGRKGVGPFIYSDPREASTRTVNITGLTDDTNLEGYRSSGTQLTLQEA